MLIKTWRLFTIVLVALSLAPALGHLLELPAKMTYDGALWVTLQQTLYGAFGTVGAAFEVGAVITTVVLAILVRHRRPAFGWTLFAAVCMGAVHAAFWIWLAPVNSTVAALSARNAAAKLDGSAQSVGVHARGARDYSNHGAYRTGIFNTR